MASYIPKKNTRPIETYIDLNGHYNKTILNYNEIQKMHKMSPQIIIKVIEEEGSQHQVEIYGENFATMSEFEKAAYQIYAAFLKNGQLVELKSSKTGFIKDPATGDSLTFKKIITCTGQLTDMFLDSLENKNTTVLLEEPATDKNKKPNVSLLDYDVVLPEIIRKRTFAERFIQIVTRKHKSFNETMIVIKKPDVFFSKESNKKFINLVNKYLTSHGKAPLEKITRWKIKKPGAHATIEHCYYSKGAKPNDIKKAIEYAKDNVSGKNTHHKRTDTCKVSISYQLDEQDFRSLRSGLNFKDKKITSHNTEATVNVTTRPDSTSLSLDKKEIHMEQDIILLAHALIDLANKAYAKTKAPFTVTISGTHNDIERILHMIEIYYIQLQNNPQMSRHAFNNINIQVTRSNPKIESLLARMGKSSKNGEGRDTYSSSSTQASAEGEHFDATKTRKSGSF